MRNLLVVLSGPSGVGKGTIAKRLVKSEESFELSISCTTRKPRRGEKDGRDYFFISHEAFREKIEKKGLLEYSEHFENYYGTPRDFVMQKLESKDIILEIDVNGGLNVKKSFPNAVLIMILPPSREEVRQRLLKRNTESIEKIENRLNRMDFELSKKDEYDYAVINDDLEKTVEEIRQIIIQEKNK